jgi:hypothetical protein
MCQGRRGVASYQKSAISADGWEGPLGLEVSVDDILHSAFKGFRAYRKVCREAGPPSSDAEVS